MGTSQQGFVALYFALLVMLVLSGIGASVFLLTLGQQRIIQNTRESLQAYYGAEAGVEDALIRLVNKQNSCDPQGSPPCSNSLGVGNASTTIEISSVVGGARTIISKGDSSNRVRTVRVVYQLTSEDVAFNFGAHVGNPSLAGGGLEMEHNDSKIIGNIFVNANIFGNSNATVTESAVVAGAGNTLSDIIIGLNAEAYNCSGATISGNVEYNLAGTNTCSVTGSVTTTSDPIATVDFPITSAMLDDWKAGAEAGGIVDGGGDVHIGSDRVLGPGKITGDLTIANGKILTLTGTLWVTGAFIPGNNAIAELDNEYADLSGALIIDGTVDISENVILRGSGTSGSFLLVIGTSSSLLEASPAIGVGNNADSAVLFAPNGILVVKNNASLVEVTAHKLLVKKATITYDIGLADAKFTSGPGGEWTVTSWKEVE